MTNFYFMNTSCKCNLFISHIKNNINLKDNQNYKNTK